MNYTCDDLTRTGGMPSGRKGSKYSAIHSALAAFKSQVPRPVIYYLASGQRLLLGALAAEVRAFENSPHPHAVDRRRKGQQTSAVSQLRDELDVMLNTARISRALEPPYGAHHVELVKNSMEGWKRLLRSKAARLVFNSGSAYVAAYLKDGRLLIDLDACETRHGSPCSPELSLRAVLVHEYHHLLSGRKGKEAYHDEFVAHWKEFDVTGKRLNKQDRVDWLNHWLLDDPNGYQYRAGNKITPKRPLIAHGPEETGRLWTAFKDNRS